MTAMRLFLLTLGVTLTLPGETSGFKLPCSNSLIKCGRPPVQPDRQRIIGGYAAQRGAWPWMVVLIEDNHVVCGGAIISDRFILTATHCFSGRSNVASNKWKVLAGKQRLDRYEHSQQSAGLSKIITHENYNASTLENDIAIVVLSKPLPFSSLIQPICIPEANKGVFTGQMCYMAGWGDTKGTGDRMAMNQVQVPVIADDVCATPQWYGDYFLPNKTFCAGYEEGGKDGCQGDSGGPLICKDGNNWVVQGISSWGYKCGAERSPGIYTEVTKFATWIQQTINRESLGICPRIG